MKFNGFDCFCIGLISLLVGFLGGVIFSQENLKTVAQSSTKALYQMKQECEKSLPRDKVCKAEINFVIEE